MPARNVMTAASNFLCCCNRAISDRPYIIHIDSIRRKIYEKFCFYFPQLPSDLLEVLP